MSYRKQHDGLVLDRDNLWDVELNNPVTILKVRGLQLFAKLLNSTNYTYDLASQDNSRAEWDEQNATVKEFVKPAVTDYDFQEQIIPYKVDVTADEITTAPQDFALVADDDDQRPLVTAYDLSFTTLGQEVEVSLPVKSTFSNDDLQVSCDSALIAVLDDTSQSIQAYKWRVRLSEIDVLVNFGYISISKFGFLDFYNDIEVETANPIYLTSNAISPEGIPALWRDLANILDHDSESTFIPITQSEIWFAYSFNVPVIPQTIILAFGDIPSPYVSTTIGKYSIEYFDELNQVWTEIVTRPLPELPANQEFLMREYPAVTDNRLKASIWGLVIEGNNGGLSVTADYYKYYLFWVKANNNYSRFEANELIFRSPDGTNISSSILTIGTNVRDYNGTTADLIDGNPDTYWRSYYPDGDYVILVVEFDKPVQLQSVEIFRNTWTGQYPTELTAYGANKNIQYDEFEVLEGYFKSLGWVELGSVDAQGYYETSLLFTIVPDLSSTCALAGFEFRENYDGVKLTTDPQQITYSWTPEKDAKLLDDDPTTAILFDLGLNISYTLVKPTFIPEFTLTAPMDVELLSAMPKDFSLVSYGVTDLTVIKITEQTNWQPGETRRFSLYGYIPEPIGNARDLTVFMDGVRPGNEFWMAYQSYAGTEFDSGKIAKFYKDADGFNWGWERYGFQYFAGIIGYVHTVLDIPIGLRSKALLEVDSSVFAAINTEFASGIIGGEEDLFDLSFPLSSYLPLRTTAVWGEYKDIQVLSIVYGRVTMTPVPYDNDGIKHVLSDADCQRVVEVKRDNNLDRAWEFYNTTDQHGHVIAVLELSNPLADGEHLAVTLDGKSHPVTGALLVNPAQVIWDILHNLVGLPVEEYMLDSFRQETWNKGIKFHGLLYDGNKTIRSQIDDLCRSAGAIWSGGINGVARIYPE